MQTLVHPENATLAAPAIATSRRIARIAGPTALALATTESINMRIFVAQSPPVVYLNGTVLFVAGVAIVQAHHRLSWAWPCLVTLTGWGLTALGLFRMVAPEWPQAKEGPVADAIFIALLVLGAVLSFVGYRRPAPSASASQV